jgi:predicted esterase
MTKEDREVDIKNYLRYLDSVVEEVLSDSGKSLVVIGFSQGAATAGRWTANTYYKVSDLVLWSGMFPHDVDVQKDIANWESMDIYALVGDADPFVDDTRFISEKEIMELKGLDMKEIKFKGGHEIRPSELRELRDRILRKH